MKHSILLALIILITSCGVQDANQQKSSNAKTNSQTKKITPKLKQNKTDIIGSWKLTSIDGKSNDNMERITLNADNSKSILGNDGCNSYTVDIEPTSSNIHFINFIKTERHCIIAAEYADDYYNALNRVNTFTKKDNVLQMLDLDGKIILNFINTK